MNSYPMFDARRLAPFLTTVLSVLAAAAQVGAGAGMAAPGGTAAPGPQSGCDERVAAQTVLQVRAPQPTDESQ